MFTVKDRDVFIERKFYKLEIFAAISRKVWTRRNSEITVKFELTEKGNSLKRVNSISVISQKILSYIR